MNAQNRLKHDAAQLIRNAENELASAKALLDKMREEGMAQLEAERMLRRSQSRLDALKRVTQ